MITLLQRFLDWWHGPVPCTMTVVCEAASCDATRTITFYDFPETDMEVGGWGIGEGGRWACWAHRDWSVER